MEDRYNVECCEFMHAHDEIVERVQKEMPGEDTLYDLTELFRIFGDSTRIRILYVLFEAEMCVCDIAALLGMTLIYATGHTPLLRLFTDLPEVLAAAERYADWGICFPACAALGLTYYGLFTGSSLTRPVFLSTLQALVAFCLAWLAFVPFWGNHGLWGAYLIFYAGRSFFLLRYWPRLRDAPFFRHGGAALC